jgi:hypothetical protein
MAVVRTWRHVVTFGRSVMDAGDRIADATAALEARMEQRGESQR